MTLHVDLAASAFLVFGRICHAIPTFLMCAGPAFLLGHNTRIGSRIALGRWAADRFIWHTSPSDGVGAIATNGRWHKARVGHRIAHRWRRATYSILHTACALLMCSVLTGELWCHFPTRPISELRALRAATSQFRRRRHALDSATALTIRKLGCALVTI
jgi:hypothetical protein